MRVALLFAAAVPTVAPSGLAQRSLHPEVAVGYFAPLRRLGPIEQATGHLKESVTVGGGLHWNPSAGPFGVRLSGAVALAEGLDVRPTPSCPAPCIGASIGNRRAWMVAGNATYSASGGPIRFRGSVGAGLRGMRHREVVCACDPQPGQLPAYRFIDRWPQVAGHLAVAVVLPAGGPSFALEIQDYIYRWTPDAWQHDLLVAIQVAH